MTRRKFSPEFKDEAVRLVIDSSRPVTDVARELGIGAETLRRWVNQFKEANTDPDALPVLTESERSELERLRKENRELRMEKEFLGKAAAFFAKEFR